MAQQAFPDGRLVYLHCSSIFSGTDAHVRKGKKILQLLEKHKASINILTNEYTLQAIAAVAKELLDEQIFESLPRAELRFPELLQLSETQVADRAASEAEAIRIETKAAHDIVLTSDEEGGEERLDVGQGEKRAELKRKLEDNAEDGDNNQSNAVKLCQDLMYQPRHGLPLPRLHPVFLPFRTQHKILALVQLLLEECCLEFGNAWVPDLMKAQNWNEVESIELTKWTKRFSKYSKSLPQSAIKTVPGKSIIEVLFETDSLRHSAVHRLPTSAAGILNMFNAAINFAEALKDTERAKKVADIKKELESCVKEIEMHQNLLECKLTDQFENIARRRAELDELERSTIEEVLGSDKKQRDEVGSALESFLVGFQQESSHCSCNHAPICHHAMASINTDESNESIRIEHEPKPPAGIREAQADAQDELGEEMSHHNDNLVIGHDIPCQGGSDGWTGGESKWSELTHPALAPTGQKQRAKMSAASCQDLPVAGKPPGFIDKAPDLETASPDLAYALNMDRRLAQHIAWKSGGLTGVSPESDAANDAIPAKESCFTTSTDIAPADEPFVILLEDEPMPEREPVPDDSWPVEEVLPERESIAHEYVALQKTLQSSQAEHIAKDFDGTEEQNLKQHNNISYDFNDPCESAPGPGIVAKRSAPFDESDVLKKPPAPPHCAVRKRSEIDSLPPPVPTSTMASVLEDATPKTPKEYGQTIALEILAGSKVLRAIVLIVACTRTAILNEARAYCTQSAQYDQTLGTILAKSYDLILMSVKMYGSRMDLSTYNVEDLSFLVGDIQKTGVPMFTFRISEVPKPLEQICSSEL